MLKGPQRVLEVKLSKASEARLPRDSFVGLGLIDLEPATGRATRGEKIDGFCLETQTSELQSLRQTMICEENLHGNLSDGPVAISGANHTSSERSSIADILFQALIWMCLKIEILNCSQLGQDDSAAKNITRSRQTVLGQFLGPNTPYLKRYS